MNRNAGILLPVSSLPGKYGIGSFSKEAYAFVDFLAKAGQTYWQILPLTPLNHLAGNDSPYKSYSAFAGNPYYISLEALIEEGLLTEAECDAADFGADAGSCDYDRLYENRLPLLRRAYERSGIYKVDAFTKFCRENAWWLDDYALFMALKDFFGGQEWREWPEDIRRHWGFAIDYYRAELYYDIEFYKFTQYEFFTQWYALKAYANAKHIKIIGDIAIYVSLDSADVWAHPELFQLDDDFNQTAVAGCPPDNFSADGQIWGTPLYRWDVHKASGYGWWMARLWHNFCLCDKLRIDHFRGLDEYFSIPYGSKTAMGGHWEKGPGMSLFEKMWESMGSKDVIIEDLGFMTESVRQMVRDSGFPNMKVLQFGFDRNDISATNDYLPHNVPEHCVIYTGTHDNAPISGWYGDLPEEDKAMIRAYYAAENTADDRMERVLTASAMMSRAETCVLPVQDYLGLGNEARVNNPAHEEGNWRWRLSVDALTPALSEEIAEITRRYGRMNWDTQEKA